MTVDAGSRRDRSQPALRLPSGTTPEPPDSRGLTRLADLIEDVAACLERPAAGAADGATDGAANGAASAAVDDPLHAIVAQCNLELEACLEVHRERESTAVTAQDELRWLVRLLRAERADPTPVMRRIRRVLGRIDALGRPGAEPE